MLNDLKSLSLKKYTIDSFKRYWTYPEDYDDKKARIVNETYIVVYSLWRNRLLARTFFLQERMKYKKMIRHATEVQRQVAGFNIKLYRLLHNCTQQGIRPRKNFYIDEQEPDPYNWHKTKWEICSINVWNLYKSYDLWTLETYIDYETWNNPLIYLNKSMHKYSAFERTSYSDDNNGMFDYLAKYEKHPQIEMLVKSGLECVLKDLSGIRWTQKGLKMLGIDKSEIYILQNGIKLQDYKKVRKECLKYKFNIQEIKKCIELKVPFDSGLELKPKLIKYLIEKDISKAEYSDHVNMMEQLGLPNQKKYLYPDDFHSCHMDLAKRIQDNKDEIIKQRCLRHKETAEKYKFEYDGYKLIPLLTPDQLQEEGNRMEHCVGSYTKKVADGRCIIYSLRDKEDNSKVTIELVGKNINQARAFHNRVPDETLSSIIKTWEKKFGLKGW